MLKQLEKCFNTMLLGYIYLRLEFDVELWMYICPDWDLCDTHGVDKKTFYSLQYVYNIIFCLQYVYKGGGGGRGFR